MFTIFTTEDILCKIARSEENSAWNKILKAQNQIVISRDPDYEYSQDADDVIDTLEMSNGLSVFDETEYIDSIKENPESVLQEPTGAFILDITPQQASEIQNKYGVVCQSIDALDESVFTRDISSISVIKGDKDVSWADLLSELREYPMNTLMIVDRYLFSYEGVHKAGVEDGLDNIKEILNELLPTTLNCNFQVLIVFDASSMDKHYSFSKIVTEVNKLKRSINRPYCCDLELLSVTNNCYLYEITHNRRIVSNYFKIEMPHLSKVFKHGLGAGICSQDVTLKYLYSGICRQKVNFKALPYRGIDNDITKFTEMLQCAKTAPTNYEYGFNGNCKYKVTDCKNRLITHNQN